MALAAPAQIAKIAERCLLISFFPLCNASTGVPEPSEERRWHQHQRASM